MVFLAWLWCSRSASFAWVVLNEQWFANLVLEDPDLAYFIILSALIPDSINLLINWSCWSPYFRGGINTKIDRSHDLSKAQYTKHCEIINRGDH